MPRQRGGQLEALLNLSEQALYDDFFAAVRRLFSSEDFDKLARSFAIMYDTHDGQEQRPGRPYWLHPTAVAMLYLELHGEAATVEGVCSALLHDTIEDQPAELVRVMTAHDSTIADVRFEGLYAIELSVGDDDAAIVENLTRPEYPPTITEQADRDTKRELKNMYQTGWVHNIILAAKYSSVDTETAQVKYCDWLINAGGLGGHEVFSEEGNTTKNVISFEKLFNKYTEQYHLWLRFIETRKGRPEHDSYRSAYEHVIQILLTTYRRYELLIEAASPANFETPQAA